MHARRPTWHLTARVRGCMMAAVRTACVSSFELQNFGKDHQMTTIGPCAKPAAPCSWDSELHNGSLVVLVITQGVGQSILIDEQLVFGLRLVCKIYESPT
jgi:hypothetical protein